MKHLKKFNEELDASEANKIELAFIKAEVSPVTTKVNIKRVYQILFIELSEPLQHVDYDEPCKIMVIDLEYSSFMINCPTLDDAVQTLDDQRYDYYEDWEIFAGQNSDRLVDVLEYNDVNFQQIENILLDFNIGVERIWGLLK